MIHNYEFNYECHSGSLDDNFFLLSIRNEEMFLSDLEIINPLENQLSSKIFERNIWLLKSNQKILMHF